MLSSVMNEGLAGMQQSQKKMQVAAQEVVRAGVPTDGSAINPGATGATPATDAGTAATDLGARNSVEAAAKTEAGVSGYNSQQGDVVEPLIEQKRQQLMFDASANVVQAANKTLGSLIDDLS